MEDNGILDLYFARDERAIEETDKKYGRYCYSIAYNILGDERDTEETVNDAYLSAWGAIPPQRPEFFASFLGKITRNIAIKKRRAGSRQKRGGTANDFSLAELEECLPAQTSVETELETKELAAVIDAFLRELPETQCDVFVRRYWYMDSIEEICRAFGFGESKVKMLLLRARKKLLEKLTKEGVNL